jgi:Uma2 family endonuclease
MKQVQESTSREIIYPETDGQPMVDNSKQYRWVVRLRENLRRRYRDQNVCVEADMFWYPVEGQPTIVNAPDVFVVLGRPDGDRSSYKQWQEDNIAPQAVFEIVSPANSSSEIAKKQEFYVEHGVLEILFYNPETFDFWGFVRQDPTQAPTLLLRLNLPWTSPVLGIRFEMEADGLAVFYPDDDSPAYTPGERFVDVQDVFADRDRLAAKLRELGIDPQTL